MIFDRLISLLSDDIGIDLGTATTLVFVRDRGIVLMEPSVVAVDAETNKVMAVGEEAKPWIGRTPLPIRAVRPMMSGVIADFEITEAMLRHFIGKVQSRRKVFPPRILVAVPSGINEVEKRAVKESALRAGAREVFLIQEPMAAAIGVGIPVQEPRGHVVVDIGGGTTEVAIISLAGIVHSQSIKTGGDSMDEAITNYLKRSSSILIGETTAERVKIDAGSAYTLNEEITIEVKGRDLMAGMPKAITVTSAEIRQALETPVANIVQTVRDTLGHCQPELSSDLVEHGIVMAGGGAKLRGLDRLLAQETGLPVTVADSPETAVARGTGIVLQNMDTYARTVRSTASRKHWWRR